MRYGTDKLNLLDVKNRFEFRKWLADNHLPENKCWAIVKRDRPNNNTTFGYLDAIEEALCFGRIDDTTKNLSDTVAAQRFVKRRKNSNRTELNKERCRRLKKLGLMADSGKAVLLNIRRRESSIIEYIRQRFCYKSRYIDFTAIGRNLMENFLSFPPLLRFNSINIVLRFIGLVWINLSRTQERALCTEIRTLAKDCSIIEYRDNNLRRRLQISSLHATKVYNK